MYLTLHLNFILSIYIYIRSPSYNNSMYTRCDIKKMNAWCALQVYQVIPWIMDQEPQRR